MSTVDSDVITAPNGAVLAVHCRGEVIKPTVVLVHGFPDDHGVWDGVARRLADDHHVVTYDVRGAGASSKPTRIGDYRLDLLAEDLQAVIDHVDGGDGVHLVGHDWGSVQGWHLVTDPARRGVLSYTSISGPCVDHLPGWIGRKARARRWRDILALWKAPLYMGLFSIPFLAPLLCRLGLVDLTITAANKAFERPEPMDSRPAGPSARRNTASVRMYAANLVPRLKNGDRAGTTVPVQVLTPTGDVFIPPVSQRDPHPDITTIHVEPVSGGHWAPAHNPAAISQHVAGWVRAHDTAQSPANPRRTP
jgi:pimeloyl-ACP methyl ester carboxylesterase